MKILGTIEIHRLGVRDSGGRFTQKITQLLTRQGKAVRALILELYLHGLASVDFELPLRGLLGKGEPLPVFCLLRAKEKWQGEYEQGKSTVTEKEK